MDVAFGAVEVVGGDWGEGVGFLAVGNFDHDRGPAPVEVLELEVRASAGLEQMIIGVVQLDCAGAGVGDAVQSATESGVRLGEGRQVFVNADCDCGSKDLVDSTGHPKGDLVRITVVLKTSFGIDKAGELVVGFDATQEFLVLRWREREGLPGRSKSGVALTQSNGVNDTVDLRWGSGSGSVGVAVDVVGGGGEGGIAAAVWGFFPSGESMARVGAGQREMLLRAQNRCITNRATRKDTHGHM